MTATLQAPGPASNLNSNGSLPSPTLPEVSMWTSKFLDMSVNCKGIYIEFMRTAVEFMRRLRGVLMITPTSTDVIAGICGSTSFDAPARTSERSSPRQKQADASRTHRMHQAFIGLIDERPVQ
jgi:hypothetical protein